MRIYNLSTRDFFLTPLLTSILPGLDSACRLSFISQFANRLSSRFCSPLPFVLDFVLFSRSELTLTTQRTASSNQHHMSYEMRWYMMAFWILLILPAFHFALAAPVAIGETLEVGFNEDAPKGRIAAWRETYEHRRRGYGWVDKRTVLE